MVKSVKLLNKLSGVSANYGPAFERLGTAKRRRNANRPYDRVELYATVAVGVLDTQKFADMLRRSDFGAISRIRSRAVFALRNHELELIYETTVSTVQTAPGPATWVSGAQQQQERPRDPAESPPAGPQASDRGLTGMPAEAPRLRFGRAMRIKQGRDFSRVRQEGQRLVYGCLIANWRKLPADGSSRLGVVTSGKIGNAIIRNRARRLLREAFRVHQYDLTQPVDLVLVARASITGKGFADVERDFLTTLRKAGLLKK